MASMTEEKTLAEPRDKEALFHLLKGELTDAGLKGAARAVFETEEAKRGLWDAFKEDGIAAARGYFNRKVGVATDVHAKGKIESKHAVRSSLQQIRVLRCRDIDDPVVTRILQVRSGTLLDVVYEIRRVFTSKPGFNIGLSWESDGAVISGKELPFLVSASRRWDTLLIQFSAPEWMDASTASREKHTPVKENADKSQDTNTSPDSDGSSYASSSDSKETFAELRQRLTFRPNNT